MSQIEKNKGTQLRKDVHKGRKKGLDGAPRVVLTPGKNENGLIIKRRCQG